MSSTLPSESIGVWSSHPAARAEVRPLRRRRSLLSTPAGRTFTVNTDAATLVRVLDAAAAESSSVSSDGSPMGWRQEFAALLPVLIEDGCLDPPTIDSEAAAQRLSAPTPVTGPTLLLGDREICRELSARLSGVSEAGEGSRENIFRAAISGELVILCVQGPDDDGVAQFGRLCADARVRWAPLELNRSVAWFGPIITPGRGADFDDVMDRRLAAASDPELHRALRGPSITPPLAAGTVATSSLLKTVADQIAAAAGASDGVIGDLVEVSQNGMVLRHPVLPLPYRPAREHPIRPASDLIDPVTGIVLRTRTIRHHRSVPPSLVTVQTDVCDIRRISRWSNNISCQGSAFADPNSATGAAIGEAIERYCGNLLDTLPVTYGSWNQLRRGPTRALDPESLVLYSDEQYEASGFPFSRLSRDLPVHWVPGRSLGADEEVLVPASMVYVNWFTAGYSDAPVTNFCPFAGIAAGPSLEFAVMSGLEEVIERHATMVWWLNAQPLDAVVPTPELLALWDEVPEDEGQKPSMIHLDNEFGVPVIAGVLHHDREKLLNVGFSARHDAEQAARKAWTEALTLQEGSRDLAVDGGAHWRAMARGELNGRSFKPWRADRRYLDDFRPDMHDVDDLMVQQQVFLDPRAQEQVAPLLDRPATRCLDDLPRLPERSLTHYQHRVERLGLEVIYVDVTSVDVASTGMRAVRVIVPGTVGNAPAAFPFLGGERVQRLAVELGWRKHPLAESELNYFPIPHA